jgi:RHS repeat-associated protein
MNHFLNFRYTKVFAFALFVLPLILRGQTTTPTIDPSPKIIPPAPNVASLGKFGDVPVGGYTGVPNIGIDFEAIGGTKLSVPISIKYHSGGIRVNDQSSVVGLSWALNAGGSISRTVKGLPDDGANGYLTTTLPNPLVPTLSQIGSNLNFYDGTASGTMDVEPDLFSFNCGSYSGKFVFDINRNIKLIPYQDVKIVPSANYNSWTIKTPDGNIYTFGGTGAIDVTYQQAADNSTTFNSAWHLTTIQSPNLDDVINLTYEGYVSSSTQKSFSRDFGGIGASTYCGGGGGGNTSIMGLTTYGRNVKTITSINGKVVFNYSACSDINIDKKLTSIVYYGNDQTTLLKSYNLLQGFYTNGTQNRLRLDKVTEVGSDGTTKPPYEFAYLNTGIYILPQQDSYAQDHWGFYNGADANNTLLPAILTNPYLNTSGNSEPGSQPGADRTPDKEFTKAGIIQKITYPTGGYTSFDFECHDFVGSDYAGEILPRKQSVEPIAGGLRIKEVRSFDGSQTTVKKYVYKRFSNSNLSSGVLLSPIAYSYNFYTYTTGPAGCFTGDIECPRYGQSSSSAVPLSLGQGSHVVYPEVTEYLGQNGEFGKTEFTFSNPTDGFSLNYAIPAITSYDWGRGLLTKKEDYSFISNTNTYVKVQKTENFYNMRDNGETINNSKVDGLVIRYWRKAPCMAVSYPTQNSSWFQWQGYSHISRWFYMDSVRVTSYDLNGLNPMTSTTALKYRADGVHTFLKETNTKNSDGKTVQSLVTYAGDFHPSLISKYMIGIPLISYQLINGKYAGGGLLEYQGTISYPNLLSPARYSSIGKDGVWDLKTVIKDINSAGLATSIWRKGSLSYPSGLYAYESYSWDSKNRLIGKSFEGLSSSYTYIPNTNLPEVITDENGLKKKFEYDPFQRLKKIYDRFTGTNAAPSDIQATTTYQYQYKDATNPYNFVGTSTTYKGDGGNPLSIKQYMDGLGRPIQTIKENYGATGKFVKSTITYDAIGREDRMYHPFESTTNGVQTPSIYIVPFKYTVYEASPLNRPIKQYNEDGTYITLAYGTNIANDVWLFSVTNNASIDVDDIVTPNNFYAANQLIKTTITNENSKVTEVFKDKLGRVILTRKKLNGQNVDTYNVYDDYGQLVMVIPPDAMDTYGYPKVNLVFCYKYDNLYRLHRKKIPGADWQKFYYDNKDLVSLTQDGNMRSTLSGGDPNKYLATQYDALGRVEKTGWVTTSDPVNFAKPRILIPDANKLTETQYYKRDAVTGQISATGTLGSNWVKHQAARILKPTAVTIPGSNFVWSYIERRPGLEYTGNPVWTGKQNLMNTSLPNRPISDIDYWGVDWSVSAYNGLQKPTVTYRYAYTTSSQVGEVRTQESYLYDNAQRLTDVMQSYALNGAGITAPTLTLANMVYNHKDQLVERNIGKQASTGKYLQSIDYDYNARGWLTAINSAFASSSLDLPLINNTDSYYYYTSLVNGLQTPPANSGEQNPDLFTEKIRYTDPVYTYPGIGPIQYNGNISQLETQVAGREAQAYSFKYDDLDRLTDATYTDVHTGAWNTKGWTSQTSTDNKYRETVTYDKRGNIQTMIRNGLQGSYITSPNIIISYFTQTDNLSYSYDPISPNRLTKVTETGNLSRGFVSANNGAATHYTYDMNGNMITDANKNIISIQYNYLNLPQVITFSGNQVIQFIYDATGAKLRKIINNNGTITTYDYVGGVEYKNNVLERIANTEGSVVSNGSGGYEYEYVLRDHLGNTRVTFNGNADGTVTVNNIKQINHYYPFGMNTEGNWNGASGKNKYQYNGKELNDDFGLNWNHHDWRFYDVSIGRFVTIDPMADEEDQESFSPYHFAADNPIRFSDPDGKNPIIPVVYGVYRVASIAWRVIRALERPNANPQEGVRLAKEISQARNLTAVRDASSTMIKPVILKNEEANTNKPAADKKAEKPNTLVPGEFAKESIPARGPEKTFTPEERKEVNELGEKNGCHSCGSKEPKTKSGNFIPDHQTPSALNEAGVPQRLYPHCLDCSRLQGGQVNKVIIQQKAGSKTLGQQKLGE